MSIEKLEKDQLFFDGGEVEEVKKRKAIVNEVSMNSVYIRMQKIIEAHGSLNLPRERRGRYKELQDITGIPAKRWQNSLTGVSRPTSEMLVAVAQLEPKLSEWLMTGAGDTKIVNGFRYSETWQEEGIIEEDFMPNGRFTITR